MNKKTIIMRPLSVPRHEVWKDQRITVTGFCFFLQQMTI